MIKCSDEEFNKIKKYFPDLDYNSSNQEIFGKLIIPPCRYEKIEKKWIIKPCNTNYDDYITGEYLILIKLNESIKCSKVYEISEKIETLAKELNKPVNDLHLYPQDKNCCLGIFIESITSLSEFIIHRVYPYFVWQAYYAKYKKTPPCGEYSHGKKGYEEAIQDYEKNITSLQKIGRNEKCPCQSGKKYKKCCLEKDEQKKFSLHSFKKRF